MFRSFLNGLVLPLPARCYHPPLQINDAGMCCDCGARVLETHPLVSLTEHGPESYWWVCGCGDEGGSFPTYNHAWDSWVDHRPRSA